ncbi:MAG: DUF2878 domain-containing protein [Marinobacter sp.]|uniref:DUF2878 domain-containing protein n=1 Tax=unclassified Marinobacter TaxID=83889 RepID=UPI00273B35A4|nr:MULTISPECIES: DUF2878 domain-containing protein [unclassified Marinobacter]MDP4546266.1 DUF2878 domain-containing protein [Marinobacter sp. MDS2]
MISSATVRNTLNFLLFQTGWLVCVLYPSLAASLLALLFVIIHLLLVSTQRGAELRFIAVGVFLGSLMDSLWLNAGILGIETPDAIQISPVWLVAIWALFMTTLCHSLNWVAKRAWLPFVLAPCAGSFAYWSASKLGAVTLPNHAVSLVVIGAGWLVLFPLLLFIRNHLVREPAS